jgi:myo-inositol catabolism protein IolC
MNIDDIVKQARGSSGRGVSAFVVRVRLEASDAALAGGGWGYHDEWAPSPVRLPGRRPLRLDLGRQLRLGLNLRTHF